MAKRISQSQIAKELGVSQSLVSLVLNGRRDRIPDETYNRVWSLAVKEGYVPRGMQPVHSPEARHSYVGVILRSGLGLTAQGNTFGHVQEGLYSELRNSQIHTAYLGCEGDLSGHQLFELLGRRDPLLGIVVFGEVKESFLRALSGLNIELLSVYATFPGLCHSVVPNEQQSLDQLVDHLYGLGHRRFAWLGGNCRLANNRIRRDAFRRRLAERGVELDERCVVNMEEAGRQEGVDAAAELMRRDGGADSTAWVCYNGLVAYGALQFAMSSGIRIPEDVSLAAAGRTNICSEVHPYLTCAGSDPVRIGKAAARLLCQMAKEESRRPGAFVNLVEPSMFDPGETSMSPSS